MHPNKPLQKYAANHDAQVRRTEEVFARLCIFVVVIARVSQIAQIMSDSWEDLSSLADLRRARMTLAV